MYRLDPKSYKVLKTPMPLEDLASITLFPSSDSVAVLEFTKLGTDLVVDMAAGGGNKISDFVVEILYATKKLNKAPPPIKFEREVKGNFYGAPKTLTLGTDPKATQDLALVKKLNAHAWQIMVASM